jgi:hypothetical protein
LQAGTRRRSSSKIVTTGRYTSPSLCLLQEPNVAEGYA